MDVWLLHLRFIRKSIAMASIFSHALVAVTIGKTFPVKTKSWAFYLAGAICGIIPDADVIMFRFGISYQHILGHRGFTHSIAFSLLLGFLMSLFFIPFSRLGTARGLKYFMYFTFCTLSHALLDAMTTGGLGIAVFAPFSNNRYFLPWRPIQVSPIGISNFFSEWGLRVIKSELLWVGIPCISLLLIIRVIKKYVKDSG